MPRKKTKATHKNGRTKKGIAYNPNHNTWEYVRSRQPHIDQERLSQNYYFKFDENMTAQTIKGGNGGFDSKRHEKKLFDHYYSEGLEAKNERYIKTGHKERCQDMAKIYTDPKTAPVETIFQVGKFSTEIDPDERKKILFNAWRDYTKELLAEFGDNIKPLDAAWHNDEQVSHIHFRATIGATDKFGHFVPNQSQALEEMGFQRPNPNKPSSRYNNALITFTDHCRERFYYHCERYGIEIDREVTSHSRRQYELEQMRMDKMKEENTKAQEQLETTREKIKHNEELLTISRNKSVNVRKYGTLEPEPEKKSISGKVKEEAKPHRTIVATEDLQELEYQARYNKVQEYKIKTVEEMERALDKDQAIQKLQQQVIDERTRANSLQIDLRKEREAKIKAECFIQEKGLEQAYEQHQIELNQEHTHTHRRR